MSVQWIKATSSADKSKNENLRIDEVAPRLAATLIRRTSREVMQPHHDDAVLVVAIAVCPQGHGCGVRGRRAGSTYVGAQGHRYSQSGRRGDRGEPAWQDSCARSRR